jgi:hypothetical protein
MGREWGGNVDGMWMWMGCGWNVDGIGWNWMWMECGWNWNWMEWGGNVDGMGRECGGNGKVFDCGVSLIILAI